MRETKIELINKRKEVSETDFLRLSKLISLYKNQKIQMATISDNTTWTHCLRLNFTLLNQFIMVIRKNDDRFVLFGFFKIHFDTCCFNGFLNDFQYFGCN